MILNYVDHCCSSFWLWISSANPLLNFFVMTFFNVDGPAIRIVSVVATR